MSTMDCSASAAADAHLRLGAAGSGGVLASIENVAASTPRGAKRQRLIPDCVPANASPGTPAQPRAARSEDPLAACLAEARELLRDPSATECDGAAPLGREQQHKRLAAIVEEFASSGRGEALYVSGLPGTGKSHTVARALRELDYSGDVVTLWINCMAISGATEVYGRIHAAIAAASGAGGASSSTPASARRRGAGNSRSSGATAAAVSAGLGGSAVTYEKLVAALSAPAGGPGTGGKASKRRRGSSGNGGGGGSGWGAVAAAGGRRVVVILDEVDALVSKGQQGVYELFMLPHQPGVRALVIGIANSIDLTERALPALKLRGCTPTLVPFPAYTTAQVSGIVKACLAQIPEKLVDPAAIELCARQVASTTGDLRLAIKACRSALDSLAAARAEHFAAAAEGEEAGAAVVGCGKPPAAAPKGPPAFVGVRDMMAALGRLAGVRSTQHGAATVASIRTLPNQQQLLLYSLSVLCPPPEDAAAGGLSRSGSGSSSGEAGAGAANSGTPTAGRNRSAASLWSEVGTPSGGHAARPVLVRTPSGGAGGGVGAAASGIVGRRLFGAGGGSGKGLGGGSGSFSSSTVIAVSFEDAYIQYCKVCRLVGVSAAPRADLRHMADLLAQSALLDVIESASAASTPSKAAAKASSVTRPVAGTPGGGRRSRGPRGFGAADSPAARGGPGGGVGGGVGDGAQLSLRVGHDEVHRALAANPALRCLVDA